VNKADLIDSVAAKLGHTKRDVTDIVESFIEETKKAVASGERVALSGFGIFEAQARKARLGRNPRTGETVQIKATKTPKFRAGAEFKAVVSGNKKAPAKKAPAKKAAAKKAPAKKAPAKKAPAKKAPAKKR
jgi:DNA-binding protein HU-beta